MLFKKLFQQKESLDFLKVDIHSHLIPGIDDGAKTLEESMQLINSLHSFGVTRIITTPHIMKDYYNNDPSSILTGLKTVREEIKKRGLSVTVDAAAEYFLDEHFFDRLKSGDDFLTIDNTYLLFETAFLNKPIFLEKAIFEIKNLGFVPLLAHPERYVYLTNEFDTVKKLYDLGCRYQMNIRSFAKKNNKQTKAFLDWSLKNKMIHFIGSDLHNQRQLSELSDILNNQKFSLDLRRQIHNNELI